MADILRENRSRGLLRASGVHVLDIGTPKTFCAVLTFSIYGRGKDEVVLASASCICCS